MKIVILTPVGKQLSTDHQRCVDALQTQQNITVLREYGIPYVDIARSLLLERARLTDADVYFWIDDDMAFDPADVEKVALNCLSNTNYDILGVAYARRLPKGGINTRFIDQQKAKFFQPGFVDVLSTGFGFTAMRKDSIERLISTLPRVKTHAIKSGCAQQVEVSPLFGSRVVDGFLVGDDDSFCAYARDADLKIGIDLEPRIWHVGSYMYGLEDSAIAVERVRTLIVDFK